MTPRINEPDYTAQHAGRALLWLMLLIGIGGSLMCSTACTYAVDRYKETDPNTQIVKEGKKAIFDVHMLRKRELELKKTDTSLDIKAKTGTDSEGVKSVGEVAIEGYKAGLKDAVLP